MKQQNNLKAFRIWFLRTLKYHKPISLKKKIIIGSIIFSISYLMMTLHAVDMSSLMYTKEQYMAGVSVGYNKKAISITQGHGILIPDNRDSSNTGLLANNPGYSIYLSVIYSLIDRNYFTVQLVQNTLNSISAILIFLIVGEFISWSIGTITGLISAISHHLAYFSNTILPDPLCSIFALIAFYLILKGKKQLQSSLKFYAFAGIAIGLSCWLRADAMLLGPFILIMLVILSTKRLMAMTLSFVMICASVLVISPITIRNYLIYKTFIPISIGQGIVLWEGIGESPGGRDLGAVAYDSEVMAQEALLYNNPLYGRSWANPDGIKRNQDRIRRSFAIIKAHPIWYTGTVLRRISKMFDYKSHADLVRTKPIITTIAEPAKPLFQPSAIGSSYIKFGEKLYWIRPLARAAQRVVKETMLLFIFIGVIVMFAVSWRKTLLVLMIPLYYVLSHSLMHWEFRYTLPMQYFLFVFASTTWVLIGTAFYSIAKKLKHRIFSRSGYSFC